MSEHAPGRHFLSFDQYLAAPGLSASMLCILHDRTPAHLRYYLDHQDEIEETPAQRFGTEAHRALFEPCEGAFHVKPEGMNLSTKAGILWRDEHTDKPILTAKEADNLFGMIDSLRAHPTVKRLMSNADFEQSLFLDKDGLRVKLRPDILPRAGNILADLKTCINASEMEFSKAMHKHNYWLKGAAYRSWTREMGMDFRYFALIAIEKSPPFACAVWTIDDVVMDAGTMIVNKLFRTYAECVETNKWPGYDERPRALGLPSWAQREIEAVA